ncbi:C6 zinc finger domain-containing protein [Cordyceps javanica]|uniref:C6 zinc finger domain-containing protein n=1 Tax=Cordyceps javanica TaxID=43265 RepID=A0A545UWE6_9HYPO|nr:C6 zinc finger domain-containing protein [Cordyceps javanica]TQW04570.1 C6 zinc finger domain protein [Cordyceps javanica]
MVGVPGRSKACNTCLKRKIKCDLAKPHCGNCAKSKRICGGYARKTAYVFSDNVVLPVTAKAAEAATDDGTLTYQGRWKGAAKNASVAASPYQGDPLRAVVHTRLQWPTDDGSSSCSSFCSSSCSPDAGSDRSSVSGLLSLGALDLQRIPMMPSLWQQLHHVFLHTYMPRRGMGAADHAGHVTGNWLLQLQGRPASLPALQTAVAAFAAARLGHDHGDARLVAQSAHLYLRSLELLRAAIASPATRLADDTLAACLALGIYELTEKPLAAPRQQPRPEARRRDQASSGGGGGGTAYSKHMTGAMMLLQLRGPAANDTPLAHSLFLGLRRQTIVTTLIKHSDTFLSHHVWRERPWRVYPKNVLDRCLDCVLDLPRLQRLADDMLRDTSDTARAAAQSGALIEQCTAALAGLDAWYASFTAHVAGPPYWSQFCTLTSLQDDAVLGKPFPVSYMFPTFSTAYLLMTYWTGLMVSHWLLFVAHRSLASLAEARACPGAGDAAGLRARTQTHKDAWVAVTRNMCQMTEYLLDDDNGKVSVTVALAVLEGAMAMFRDGTDDWRREKAWVAEMMALTATKLNQASMVVM